MKKIITIGILMISAISSLIGCSDRETSQINVPIIKAEATTTTPNKNDYYDVRLSSYLSFQYIRGFIDDASRAKELLPLSEDKMVKFKDNYNKCQGIYDELIKLEVPSEYSKYNKDYMKTLEYFLTVSKDIIKNNKQFTKEESLVNMEMSRNFQLSNDAIFGIDNSKNK